MTTLGEVAARDGALDEGAFLARHPHPVLLHPPLDSQPGLSGFQTDLTDARSTLEEIDKHLTTRPSLLVTPVVKKDGNLFPSRICLGRTRNNDLVILHPRISKFHAYFTTGEEGAYFITDAGSTNGTFLDGKRLPTQRRVPLRDRCIISLGRHFHFRFHTPEGFYLVARALWQQGLH